MLRIVGTLNIIYGIAALDSANAFVNDTRYVLTNLNTLGWVLIILGAIRCPAVVGRRYPWWSLGVFALCVIVVHGILVYGDEEPAVRT